MGRVQSLDVGSGCLRPYEGHVRPAQQLQNGLWQNIKDYDDGGCSDSFPLRRKIRAVAFDADIPTAPEGR